MEGSLVRDLLKASKGNQQMSKVMRTDKEFLID